MADEPKKEDKKEEVAEQSLEDVVAEKVKEEAVVEDKKEEVDTKTTVEPDKTTVEPDKEPEDDKPEDKAKDEGDTKVETIPVEDAKELAKEVETKTKDKVKEEILAALGVTDEEKKEAEEAGYETPWEKRKETGPKDWDELLEASAELTDFRREAQETKAKEVEEEQKAKADEYFKKQNEVWDIQLDELREAGHLPKIDPEVRKKLNDGKGLTTDEKKDTGLVAQYNIIKMMNDVSVERQKTGKPAVTNLKEIYYEYYSKKEDDSSQPAGAEAPVSGGTTPITPSDEMKYEDIHEKSFEDILKGS